MPEQEIVCNGFRGILRASENFQNEKTEFEYLSDGVNAVLDLQGNYHVMTGYESLYSNGAITPLNLYYSYSIKKLLWTTGTTLYVFNPIDNTVITKAAAVAGSSSISYEDWPSNSAVLIHDGTTLQKMLADGTLTTIVAPAGNCIRIFKNTLFIAHGTMISPSSQGDFTTFDSGDDISVPNGGLFVLAMTELNGVLRVHKGNTVYGISGTIFSGAAEEKDLVVSDLKTGNSAISQFSVCNYDKIEYFIARDGIFATKGGKHERICRNIDSILNESWTGPPILSTICPVIPAYGADFGSKYIMLSFIDANGLDIHPWRYNLETGDWMKIFFPNNIVSLVYNGDDNRVYIGFPGKICQFVNKSTFDGTAILGYIQTNLIDNKSRLRDKQWSELFPYPGDYDGLTLYAGVEGYTPTHLVAMQTNKGVPTDSYEFRPMLNSKMLSLRASKIGGGQFLFGGFVLTVAGDDEQNDSRNWADGRKYATEKMMTYAPILQSGVVTLTAGQHTVALSSGSITLPDTIAVLATYRGAANAKVCAIDVNNQVTIDAGITVSAGDKLYWVAIAPSRQLFDSYIRGGRGLLSTSKYVNHNLTKTPDVLFGMPDNNNPLQLGTADARRMFAVPPSGGAFFQWMVAKNGTIDAWFKVGNTSGGGTVTHGLGSGAVPSALILIPMNNATCPTWQITGLTSTTFTYTSSDATTFSWMVVK